MHQCSFTALIYGRDAVFDWSSGWDLSRVPLGRWWAMTHWDAGCRAAATAAGHQTRSRESEREGATQEKATKVPPSQFSDFNSLNPQPYCFFLFWTPSPPISLSLSLSCFLLHTRTHISAQSPVLPLSYPGRWMRRTESSGCSRRKSCLLGVGGALKGPSLTLSLFLSFFFSGFLYHSVSLSLFFSFFFFSLCFSPLFLFFSHFSFLYFFVTNTFFAVPWRQTPPSGRWPPSTSLPCGCSFLPPPPPFF